MMILERVVFAICAVLLLTPDSAFDIETYFGIVQNTHIVGFVIFTISMILHKKLFKEKKEFATAV